MSIPASQDLLQQRGGVRSADEKLDSKAPRASARALASPELKKAAPLLEGVYIAGPRSFPCEF